MTLVNDLDAVATPASTQGVTTNELILHIGSPKTGTTSIQRYLCNNRKELLEKNWSVLKSKWGGGNLTTEKLQLDHLFTNKPAADHYIYSDEGIFNQIVDTKQIRKIKDVASKYVSHIKIVAYLRRQDSFGISLKQQQIVLPKNIFGTSQVALPDLDKTNMERFDFFKIMSRWGDVFGDKNILIRIYDKNELINGDVVSDFLSTNNIPDLKRQRERENPARGKEVVLVNFKMQELDIEKTTKDIISKSLDTSDQLTPSTDESKDFYALFKESNKKLNDRFKINKNAYVFSDDFSMYPAKGNGQWTDSTANQAISNILKGVKRLPVLKPKDKNTIRDSAIELEKINLDLSYRLMLIASKTNPNSVFIETKLKYYKVKLALKGKCANEGRPSKMSTLAAALSLSSSFIKKNWPH